MAASVCMNHPEREATSRCHTCHKPLCTDCSIEDATNTFCSIKCEENYRKFAGRKVVEKGPGILARLWGWTMTLLFLAGLLAVGVFIGARFLNIGFCIDLLKRVGL
jgi:hypothetical protein